MLVAVMFVMLTPVWGILLVRGQTEVWEGLLLGAAGLSCAVMGSWAKARGRSAAWGLLGLSCLPGLLAVVFLPRCCGWCGRPGRRKPGTCADCGGPL